MEYYENRHDNWNLLVCGHSPVTRENLLKIINTEDQNQRNLLIDQLVETLSKNNNETGFISKNDEVTICRDPFNERAVFLDDNELYYTFFYHLREEMLSNKTTNECFEYRIVSVLRDAARDYFGPRQFSSSDEQAKAHEKRENLALIRKDPISGEEFVPSIREYKSQNCAECVELSAFCYNALLMCGIESFYVCSFSAEIQGKYSPHAFTMFKGVQEDNLGKLFLCDLAQNRRKCLNKTNVDVVKLFNETTPLAVERKNDSHFDYYLFPNDSVNIPTYYFRDEVKTTTKSTSGDGKQ